jgi:hypothetical protein
MIKKYKQTLKIVLIAIFSSSLLITGVSAASSKSSSSTSKSSSSKSTASQTSSTATTQTNLSNDVTQSFSAGSNVQTGMAVQLDPKDSTAVIPLSSVNVKQFLGIVTPNNNATIVITPSTPNKDQVLVTPHGELAVLVSNQNGPIVTGDYISMSAVDGIGMKTDNTISTVIGRAQAGFDGKHNIVSSIQVTNSFKKTVPVAVGRIPIVINVTHNPSFKQNNSDYVPSFIGKIVFQVTSKNVSAARVYIAIVLLLGLAVLAGHMLYGGVRGGMIAVGRQPLSRKSVIFSLIQTLFFAMCLFLAGVAGIYFFLKI